MRNVVFAAAALVALASGSAFAASNRSEGYVDGPTRAIAVRQVLSATGSEALPALGAQVSFVRADTANLPNASSGLMQTANSLPAGALDGSPASLYAAAVRPYFAARTDDGAGFVLGAAN